MKRLPLISANLLFAAGVLGCAGGDSPAGPDTTPAVKPIATIKIRAIPVDGWTIGDGFVLSRRSSSAVDSVPLDASGLATLRAEQGSVLDLRVDVASPRKYHATTSVHTVVGDTTLEVAMIPTTWVVQLGKYAGTRRPIDVVEAFGSDNDDTHFLNYFAPSRKILVAWPESALPIAVGFDTTGSTRRWEAADSAWFWSAAGDINDVMGRRVFSPTGSVAITTRNVIGVHVGTDNRGYFGSLGVNLDDCHSPVRACRDLHGAVLLTWGIFFHSIFDEGNFRSMQHELMHALGFGHACHWPSIMMHTGGTCGSIVPVRVSVDDVAYMELVFHLATVLVDHPQAWNLDEALAGAR